MLQTELFHSPKMGRVKRIHFVGIGGVGMCGIAEMLSREGYIISGSDLSEGAVIEQLRALGINVIVGHRAENIDNTDVVVQSSAISDDNVEIVAAKKSKIPILPRAAMLAELMRFRQGIAISGTHGKTTTTSLVASLLTEGLLDPSYVVGGKVNSSGTNAKLGSSAYCVVEADESDASFLYLKPMMAVVTNIDQDHMSTYNGDFKKLRETFIEFLHHLPFYGLAVVCIDDEEICNIIPDIQRPIATYGFKETADFCGFNWQQKGMSSFFSVRRPAPHKTLDIEFNWPGKHNVLNALAAIAIATELGVSDEDIVSGLFKFAGVGRRFQMLGERDFTSGRALVVDDYGHHPREIKATIDAFRAAWPDKRLIHIFQPHRYTRTRDLFNEFVDVLSMSDQLLLLDIYSAGEGAISGISSETLVSQINNKIQKASLINETTIESKLNSVILDGDVILIQGAGSIGKLASNLMKE
ncbi:MAG: UDP-N-acetylmuramate--L-alanine ligase [Legionellaceae bacterium]|nr:UDP-N-acetylmuramate--L-alanine ligase [Legionellaceae bacterium]